MLIIIADQLGRSVGDMCKGAFLPGLMLTGFYALYVILLAVIKPRGACTAPEARTLRARQRQERCSIAAGVDLPSAVASIYVARTWPPRTWWSGEP